MKVLNFILIAFALFETRELKLLSDRKLRITQSAASSHHSRENRKLSKISELLSTDDVEEMAEKSRVSEFDARQMAINASQKQQRLSYLLGLVNSFKLTMEEVTSSLNGQISQVNGLLSQVRG